MALTGPEIVLYEVEDGIATITINREERMNAISTETFDLVEARMREFDADPAAHVAILTGAGERAFCAGGDLKEFSERGVTQVSQFRKDTPARYPSASYSWEIDKPIIAAVNGHALAGGFRFALLCDMRIAADHATFGISEAKVGRAAPWAMSLLWAIPSAVSMELLLTGDSISAQRAYEIGFVNRVVPQSELMTAARALANRIKPNAPLTLRAHKLALYRSMDVGRTNGSMMADDLCRELYTSEDAQEGQRAFAEKRPPEWTGR
ncbi:enoyl-CoA hydratase/isomerase family protein [Rhodococcus qingshengii]|jgi:enoyl-CoA hydratase/carnithine racemase|uniref:enoyl-CoA hydratase/isomerase family protein n=1 Tax=Rhodococcus qingshengii TaxID=334542 RepID=UPI001BEBDF74|nr:enoyl-CoA hydratase-related protein [Rhodococcus qingshengii]MBT2273644.1 enoyl-CoA hydratase/isomerase family protein [Rhodococcus qingshengii]